MAARWGPEAALWPGAEPGREGKQAAPAVPLPAGETRLLGAMARSQRPVSRLTAPSAQQARNPLPRRPRCSPLGEALFLAAAVAVAGAAAVVGGRTSLGVRHSCPIEGYNPFCFNDK